VKKQKLSQGDYAELIATAKKIVKYEGGEKVEGYTLYTRFAQLKTLDASMANFKKSKASKPIDLSAFNAKSGKRGKS
jgi:hypothetical protein